MDKKLIFEILGIEETTDENEVTMAYRTKLKVTHPEENPEGFKKLRQAYEEAIYIPCAIFFTILNICPISLYV